MMNVRTGALALALVAMPLFANQTRSQTPDEPMRLKTEVTNVYASPLPAEEGQSVSKETRRGKSLRGGACKTWRGFGNLAGRMLNVDETIPPARSRRVLDRDVPDVQSLTNNNSAR